MSTRVAVIDIGSNSVQLLVVEVNDGQWRQLAATEFVTRLAERLAAGRPLDQAACQRTLEAVETSAAGARELGAGRVWAVGTRAFRLAADGSAFAARLGNVVGGPVEILSAAREAELGFEGAVAGLGCTAGPVLSVDIGGGSTEIVAGWDARPVEHVSLPLGAVVLTERYLQRDPSPPAEVSLLRETVSEAVRGADLIGRHLDGEGRRGPLVGSGGTLVTLAAMAARLDSYRADVVHGSRLTREVLRAQCADLAARSIASRASLPGLSPARAPTILAGACIADVIVSVTGAEEFLVSDQGLRHAVLRERLLALGMMRQASPGTLRAVPIPRGDGALNSRED